MRTGSEMEVEPGFDEVEVDDIEHGNYQQSTPARSETEDTQRGSRRLQENEKRAAMHFELYQAARQGNWEIAEKIYETEVKEINHRITKGGETALHIAVSAGQTDFVRKLIQRMSKKAIKARDNLGNTAFCNAASSGNVELAQEMLNKVPYLANIRGIKRMLPIYVAALLGHREMVSYLYDRTSDKVLKDAERIDLLVTLIDNDIYDGALRMVENHKALASARDGNGTTALAALARKKIGQARAKCFNLLCYGSDQKSNPLPRKAYELLRRLCKEVLFNVSPRELIFKAAEQGNLELLTILIRSYPHLVFEVDKNNYSIFHIAVLHRHADAFKLIHEIGSSKSLISALKDGKKNNLLHLAAKLSPENKLNATPGVALQLQHDLQWFEDVKKVVKKCHVEAKNEKNQTPEEIFLKEHEDLLAKGAQWTRDTTGSCMLVATLIATVVFAAAFTVPGGNNQEGNPIFLHKAKFQVFAIAEAISLIFSISAVSTFLSILTSPKAPTDFLHSLPKKLVYGLGMVFISVMAIVVAYIAAIFIIFKNGLVRIAIPIAVISVFPVILFIWQQSGLLCYVLRLTSKSKHRFQLNNPTIFDAGDSEEATQKKGVADVSED